MRLVTGSLSKTVLGADGGKMAAIRTSPNFGTRRGGARPSLVVLHYTAMATVEEAVARLCSPEFQVSAHYVVDEGGGICSLVEERFRAWHAGSGEWDGLPDVNSRSIGIEIANPGDRPFPNQQMEAVAGLVADIQDRWNIDPRGVIGHSDMAPGRKIDPGPRFDWRRLALLGLSVWPDLDAEAEPDRRAFASDSARFGYPELTDADDDREFHCLLQAVRSRFRPWAAGPLDRRDMGIVSSLADSIPS